MITRDNYEEFFLLYTDNELSEAERHEVERFVDDNPDLRDEWETLLQCKFSPDTRLAFPGRESLHRAEIEGSAYTGALLSYIDDELDAEERARIEALILQQPRVAIELAVLRQTISQPDPAIVFTEKDLLYREEKNRRIIPLPWLRVGIAAAVAGAIVVFLTLPKQPVTKPVVVVPTHRDSTLIAHNSGTPVTPAPSAALHSMEGHPTTQSVRPAQQQLIHRQKPQSQDLATVATTRKADPANPATQVRDTDPVRTDLVAINTNRVSPVRGTDPTGANRAVTDPISTGPIGSMAPKEGPSINVVYAVQQGIPKDQSSFATQALQDEANDERNNNYVSEEPASPGKTALRGIFRKLKRTLGKTADRDDDGNRQVLVGAFQVSLD